LDIREQLWRLRRDYGQRALDEREVPTDPFDLLRAWLKEALEAGLLDPNAVALATVSPDGQPSVRAVLLRDMNERGFVFFTNYESRKAKELQHNPRAAMLFLWVPLERQVRVEGDRGTGERRRVGRLLPHPTARLPIGGLGIASK
jgi:pyridoxamine 5'-phosphate oxidase